MGKRAFIGAVLCAVGAINSKNSLRGSREVSLNERYSCEGAINFGVSPVTKARRALYKRGGV